MSYQLGALGSECMVPDGVTGQCYDQMYGFGQECQVQDPWTGECLDEYLPDVPPGGGICPPGWELSGSRCVPTVGPEYSECPAGQMKDPITGICVAPITCPEGWIKEPTTGICFPPGGGWPGEEPPTGLCPEGAVHGPTGQCVCLEGTYLDPLGERCIPSDLPVPPPPVCPPGTTGIYPDCIPAPSNGCSEGYVKGPSGGCVKVAEEAKASLVVPIVIGVVGIGLVAALLYKGRV